MVPYPVRKYLKQTNAPFAFLRSGIIRFGQLGQATLGPVTFKVPTLGFKNRAHVQGTEVIPIVLWVTQEAAEAMGASRDEELEAFLQNRITPPKQGRAVKAAASQEDV